MITMAGQLPAGGSDPTILRRRCAGLIPSQVVHDGNPPVRKDLIDDRDAMLEAVHDWTCSEWTLRSDRSRESERQWSNIEACGLRDHFAGFAMPAPHAGVEFNADRSVQMA